MCEFMGKAKLHINFFAFICLFVFVITSSAFADMYGADSPHSSLYGYTCDSCHYMAEGTVPSWAYHEPQDIDDTPYNRLCWQCHNGGPSGIPAALTHSSQSTSATYHQDKTTEYGFTGWSIECRTCHWPHQHLQVHAYGPASYVAQGNSIDIWVDTYPNQLSTLTVDGTPWTDDQYNGYYLIPNTAQPSYNYKITDTTNKNTLTVEARIDLTKASAGNPFAIYYGKYIKNTIKTPFSGTKTVRLFNNTGTNSFADGNSTYDGICEVCHTLANHYRNTGPSGDHDQNHSNIEGKNGTDCIDCHSHLAGFAHGGGPGGPECGDPSCHGGTGSHSAHLNNADLTCYNCHNTNKFPSFKSGDDDDEDGFISLSETNVCEDCHQDGTVVATGIRNVVLINGLPFDNENVWGVATIDCTGCHSVGPAYASGSPKANTHGVHSSFSCENCHNATTKDGATINNGEKHNSNAYNLNPGSGVNFVYSFDAEGGTCSNISCHGNTDAQWGHGACLGCHDVTQGSRIAAGSQFSFNSHHVQNVTMENSHCYQCHWEANSDGTINATYHGGYFSSGEEVNLVIYGTGTRPGSYTESGTGIAYTPDGSRGEIAKINDHCLSCHSDKNNNTEPFGDCNTPRQYAWDRNSIAARYSQSNTTTWGKYSTDDYPNVAEKNITKAYSAHGNALSNQGGFSSSTGLDETVPNTRGGYEKVLCFDCHNSHGSNAGGTTSSYDTFNGTQNGGLLKNTFANKGGYTVFYVPTANIDDSDNNPYNAGADLCFDCHMTQNADDTPWGYEETFGATAPIMGYKDGIRFGTGYSGTKQRFPYRTGRTNKGGHMMASLSLKGLNGTHEGDEALHQINGLCTPCHDPHGVSPSLGDNQVYGVPLLKGTWLTSPYKEDSPEMTGTRSTSICAQDGDTSDCPEQPWYDDTHDRHWNTDRVTFDTDSNIHNYKSDGVDFVAGQQVTGMGNGKIQEDDSMFAGLCLRCHPKSNLTDGTNKNTAFKTVDRIHETVDGWGNNKEHTFPCSKCHVPHNSGLGRLMQTNCLNFNHRMQVVSGGQPSSYNYGGWGGTEGTWGKFPGTTQVKIDTWWPLRLPCHGVSGAAGGGSWPDNELWNEVTPW